jgi:tetratricopeptide (TPR) repeat protein
MRTHHGSPLLSRLGALALGAAVTASTGDALVLAQTPVAQAPAPTARKRREPPPALIPTAEVVAAQKQYQSGNYAGAVAQAKAALNKNERYTPAMLVMAKAYYKLRKFEWVRTLWEMMQKNGASDPEKGELYHLLAFLELDKQNVPGAIEMLRKATELRPENAVLWNNLGAQYLAAKNYREAAPALEKAVQLQPAFAKAFVNLGSAYRGLKDYGRAQASYERALQLYANYADAVFHLGILYLDADKVANMDTTARLNASITYLQRYRQMLVAANLPLQGDPVDTYIAEAQDKIVKEQKRLERLKKQEERDRQRAAQKTAAPATPGAAPAPASPGATPPR